MHQTEQLLIDLIREDLICTTSNHAINLCFLDANISSLGIMKLVQLQNTLQNQQQTLQLATNRYDIHLANPSVTFNDFSFDLSNNIENVYFRIAKEKQINLHIIEQSFKRINHGKLIFIGYKTDGMPSLIKTIKKHYYCDITLNKHSKQLQILECRINSRQIVQLSEPAYEQLSLVQHQDFKFYSKAGSFGWQKIDRGSALLMEYIEQSDIEIQHNVLDLGCGYGYLSIMAVQKGWRYIDATDNCAAAISACERNFKHFNINGNVFASNCALNHHKRYDVVLCNPPFHQGFDHNKDLSMLFIKQIAAKLKSTGHAFVVVNQFISLEKWAPPYFKHCRLLAKHEGFKLFKLQGPTKH